METQRNADDGISAESVNEKAKQGGQGEEKLSSCFCCGGDTGKSGSIRPLLIADADQIIQTDLIQLRQTDGNGDRQLPDAFFISGIHIAVAAEIVGNLADRQIVVRAQILQSLILVFFRLFTETIILRFTIILISHFRLHWTVMYPMKN